MVDAVIGHFVSHGILGIDGLRADGLDCCERMVMLICGVSTVLSGMPSLPTRGCLNLNPAGGLVAGSL